MTVVRVADSDLGDMSERRTDGAAAIVDTVAAAAWTAGNVGLDFAEAIANWNGCPAAGDIRGASGDGSYVFLDDTAAECAVLNAAAFRRPDGSVDIDGFRHAARLMTLALDISLMSTALPSPRLARRVWDFRPLSLSVGGVGALLMACAIPYDSDEGRALCAGLCALLTGAASLTSSEIADELGPCPAYPDNATALQRLIAARHDALRDRVETSPMGIADAAQAIWQQALSAGEKSGLRNAYLTSVCSAPRESTVLDCLAPGVAPVASLVRWEPTGTGGWRKTIVSAVPAALRTLGYSTTEADAICRHVAGHGTLAHAPGVNHETLRRRGFADAAIVTVEAALAYADDLSLVFNRWVLGDDFCRRMLGFTADELADGNFDMLAALGFSDAGIEAATIHCFGAHTMEGAPRLKPEHLPVFDCGEPQGARGRRRVPPEGVVRMMAAAQPFVSGGIGHAVAMPGAATVEDCREILRLAWRLGLKSLVLRGREAGPALPLHREDRTARMAGRTGLSLVASGGQRVDMRTGSISDNGVPASAEHAPTPSTDGRHRSGPIDDPASPETVIAAGPEKAGGDAETSRSASSLAARSTASVPSSAGAVVEQRQV